MIRRWWLRLVAALAARLIDYAATREPDQPIGPPDDRYLLRWWLTPWSGWYRHDAQGSAIDPSTLRWWQRALTRLPGIYLHAFLRSDDDRALHDHPWANCSLLLFGEYTEHTIASGGIHRRVIRRAGAVKFRRAKSAHRVELHAGGPVWSLFFTGIRLRHWGFHCPERGWVHWRAFTDPATGGATIGKGCEQ